MSRNTVLKFVQAINLRDVEKISALMSTDHVFIDTWGNKEDKAQMERGWAEYLKLFPDYLIEISHVFQEAELLVLLGHASGTYKGQVTEDNKYYWKLPAAWKAVVENNKIKEWQVYCDAKIPFDIMNYEDQKMILKIKDEGCCDNKK